MTKLIIFLMAFWAAPMSPPVAPIAQLDTQIETVDAKRITFTLRNNSLKSIPLLIPGVMNPNLSPASNSGVSLKIGQEILFKYRGKKRVLLIVSEDLDGRVINASKLLKQRKAEIDKAKKAKQSRK